MWQRRSAVAVAITGVLSGCSSLQDSLEQRVSISEQCRLATSIAPASLTTAGPLASIQLGNIGVCSVSSGEHLLPMCSLDQIVTKYGLATDSILRAPLPGLTKEEATLAARRKELFDQMKTFQTAVSVLRASLHALAAEVRPLDDRFKEVAVTMKTGNVFDRAESIRQVTSKASALGEKLAQVRYALDDVRRERRSLEASLDAHAKFELAAWDANLRFQLERFEQVLSGDYALIVQEGVKDQVLTHVARRTLEMLHGSLKATDAVVRQLDDKAYGAVSVGYLVFGPDIQKAVDKAFENLGSVNLKRQDQKALSELQKAPPTSRAPLWSKPMKMELRRAACENLVQGTQFSMMTELLDTMIITHVEKEFPVLAEADPKAPATPAPWPEDRTHLIGAASSPLEILPFSLTDTISSDSAVATVTSPQPGASGPPKEVTPAGVHMTNAWMARQQLLMQAIAAKMNAAKGNGVDPVWAFREIETVDESAVQRLADAATAKAVDDAVRLDPSMLGKAATEVNNQLMNNVNVVTAATAVSNAAVTLKVNLSVSNVNTFNPTNYNNINPVINLTAPARSSAAPSLCAAGDFVRAGALCTSDETGVVISLSHPAFQDDSCRASDLEPTLSAIGRRIADFRARYGIHHTATIEGYASVPRAQLAKCAAVARAPESACNYTNHLRTSVEVADCKSRLGDRNHTLSAARARNAASVLERAGQGAVTVNSLYAMGTQTAQLRGGPASADQTIVIRLQPRTPK